MPGLDRLDPGIHETDMPAPLGVDGRVTPGTARQGRPSGGGKDDVPCVWARAAASGDPVKTKRAPAATRPPALTPEQALWLELMPFYIREAWLLDERKLEEWLDLFTEDVLYFMPRRKNVLRREAHREVTPLGDLAILEEDKCYLEMRVARLETGMAWAEDPPSRTRQLIGNLEVVSLENGEVEAKTAFLD